MIELYKKEWQKLCLKNTKIYFKGWFDFSDKIYKSPEEIEFFFLDVINLESLLDLAKNFNGNFSFIIMKEKDIFLIVDRLRTYPLFYSWPNNELVVTDNIIECLKDQKIEDKTDDLVLEQFLASNFVFGNKTIFKNSFSVQPGSIVHLNKIEKTSNEVFYFKWLPNMESGDQLKNVKEEAQIQDRIFLNVFQRMLRSHNSTGNWILPLSGGYDSRTIANYLYKLGIKNVICFSYGIKGNLQSQIAEKIAKKLGYEYHFVDYKKWASRLQKSNHLEKYVEFAFNGTSVAHLQDFTAVFALKESGVLNKGDVFVPGHTLDFITGDHLNGGMLKIRTPEAVVENTKRHFSELNYVSKNKKRYYRL